MKYTRFPLIFIFTIIVILIISGCRNENQNQWLQFRGPGTMGLAPKNAIPPTDFGVNKNVLWKMDLPEGLSSPIVVDDNLIVTGVNRSEKKYYVLNIHPNNGNLIWEKEIVVDTLERINRLSSPAAATPASDGKYIYCYFPTKGLICYDLSGKEVWHTPIEFHEVMHGSGTSPVVHKHYVILNFDNMENPSILTYNKTNGKLIWEKKLNNDIPIWNSTSWSTPVINNNQVIIHRFGKIEGLEIETGNTVWQFDISTIGESTPVVKDNKLYVNAWITRGEKSLWGDIQDFDKIFVENDLNEDAKLSKNEFPKGLVLFKRSKETEIAGKWLLSWGLIKEFDGDKDNYISEEEWREFSSTMESYTKHGLVAIQLGSKGNITFESELWKVKEDIPETPSVLLADDYLYMIKSGGILTCVNAQSGEIVYKEKLGASGAYFASPLLANELIYFSSYNGKITIVKSGKTYEVVNQVELGDKIGASPVALNDILYIRTMDHLYAFKE